MLNLTQRLKVAYVHMKSRKKIINGLSLFLNKYELHTQKSSRYKYYFLNFNSIKILSQDVPGI